MHMIIGHTYDNTLQIKSKVNISLPKVTVLNPSDLLGKGKTCFSQKRYVRVID
jgi:hypothetical protein